MDDGRFLLRNQLCFRLYTASRLITQAYTPLLAPHGLTYPQYLVLLVLWEEDGMKVNDIAKRLLLETSTVTPLLKRMEADGLLTRGRGTDDGRTVRVRLTDRGRDLRKTLSSVPGQLGGRVLCDCLTPEALPGLTASLDALIGRLRPPQERPEPSDPVKKPKIR